METILLPLILLILLLMLVSAFLSASETALISLSKIRMRHLIDKQVKHSKSIQRLIMKSDKLVTAILVGNNFVNIAISAISTFIFIKLFGEKVGVITSTIVVAFVILILCEITPKIFAIRYSEKVSLAVSPVMEIFVFILRPLILFFTGISNFILRLFGLPQTYRSSLITEEELRLMIEVGKEEGVLTDEERKMLHRIFEFGDTKVSQVMVPLEEMICVDIKSDSRQLIKLFAEEGYSRIPVYTQVRENIVGVIHSRDLIYVLQDKELFHVTDLINTIYSVPQEKRVNELLRDFQRMKIQIATVVDKNNKTCGMVTLEDLIEEIVGEIEETSKF
ncbi:MAG: CNNM domain-containing protein [Candidatus Omnitrophota bacterium]